MITQEIVRELLDYDTETGKLTWRERDRKWFKADHDYSSWNTRFSGKEAFTAINSRGYYQGFILGKQYKAHRIIWFHQTGKWSKEIDHINHDGKDNCWINLREVSHKENSRNQSLFRTNTSGHIGVSWDKQNQKWIAQIVVNKKVIRVGRFGLLCEAVSARKAAEQKYGFHENHGEQRP